MAFSNCPNDSGSGDLQRLEKTMKESFHKLSMRILGQEKCQEAIWTDVTALNLQQTQIMSRLKNGDGGIAAGEENRPLNVNLLNLYFATGQPKIDFPKFVEPSWVVV